MINEQGAGLEQKITEQGVEKMIIGQGAGLEQKFTEQGVGLEKMINEQAEDHAEQGVGLEKMINEQGAGLEQKMSRGLGWRR